MKITYHQSHVSRAGECVPIRDLECGERGFLVLTGDIRRHFWKDMNGNILSDMYFGGVRSEGFLIWNAKELASTINVGMTFIEIIE